MKTIIIFLISLFAFTIQANAQTTYSSLEVIDGEETGYTLDITIYENSDGSVDYEINSRNATQDDKVLSYYLVDDNINETNDGINIIADSNTFYIPFDPNESATEIEYGGEVDFDCMCGVMKDNLSCIPEYTDNSGGGLDMSCDDVSCPEDCNHSFYIISTRLGGSGIIIEANNVSKL